MHQGNELGLPANAVNTNRPLSVATKINKRENVTGLLAPEQSIAANFLFTLFHNGDRDRRISMNYMHIYIYIYIYI